MPGAASLGLVDSAGRPACGVPGSTSAGRAPRSPASRGKDRPGPTLRRSDPHLALGPCGRRTRAERSQVPGPQARGGCARRRRAVAAPGAGSRDAPSPYARAGRRPLRATSAAARRRTNRPGPPRGGAAARIVPPRAAGPPLPPVPGGARGRRNRGTWARAPPLSPGREPAQTRPRRSLPEPLCDAARGTGSRGAEPAGTASAWT